MKIYKSLIAVLGWEERCYLGLKEDIGSSRINNLILICFKEALSISANNLLKIENHCIEMDICLHKIELTYIDDPVRSWKLLQETIKKNIELNSNVLLNISTMPRDTIWSLLFFLRQRKAQVDYVYYQPKGYNQAWLSKEPLKPRLLFKHSGIAKLGIPTALIILTGFDTDRTGQLVNFYEPKTTLLGIQKGNQFENETRNDKRKHVDECKGETACSVFELDAYSTDHGLSQIKKAVNSLKNHNIIISSLGPKLTSIALYRAYLENPNLALSYVPIKDYNPSYSIGIGEKTIGSL